MPADVLILSITITKRIVILAKCIRKYLLYDYECFEKINNADKMVN